MLRVSRQSAAQERRTVERETNGARGLTLGRVRGRRSGGSAPLFLARRCAQSFEFEPPLLLGAERCETAPGFGERDHQEST